MKTCPRCNGTGIDPNEEGTGARMAKIRKAKGMTLKQMAAAIGVSIPFLCQLEHGQRRWKQEWINGYIK